MTDALTTALRLTKPTVGADTDTWGLLVNGDLDYVDEATNQSVTVAIADANMSLIADGSSSDQARYFRYSFTGALTADRTVTLPANVKVGFASNNTTGGKNVILSAGGTTLSLADSSWTFFYCDGSNVTAPSLGLTIAAASVLPTWKKIATYAAAAATSQTILLPSTYQRFRLTLQGLTVGTGGTQMIAQFSADGGSNFLTSYQAYGFIQSGATLNVYNSSGTTIAVTGTPSTSSVTDAAFEIWPGSVSLHATLRGTGIGIDSGASSYVAQQAGHNAATGVINAMRVQNSGGTYTGTLILEGLA